MWTKQAGEQVGGWTVCGFAGLRNGWFENLISIKYMLIDKDNNYIHNLMTSTDTRYANYGKQKWLR
jgi:hypothetical protein